MLRTMRTGFVRPRKPLILALALALVPALGASAVQTGSAAQVIFREGVHVVSERRLPSGGYEYQYAELASQATAGAKGSEQVHADGDHVTHSGSALLSEPVDCNIQGAYAWGRLCGINRVHWSGTHPVVYFIDYSGAAWPTYEAVVQWNQSTALDAGYRTSASICTGATHCVGVFSAAYTYQCAGITNWVGCTHLFTDANRNITNSTYIDLNDRYSGTYAQNQITTCHEEGHALGLDHNLFTTSCLYFERDPGVSKYPANGDYLMLDSIY